MATITGGPSTYDVAITGMTGSGTVIVNVSANAATSTVSGFLNSASTSTDNTVTFLPSPPTVTIDQAAGQADPATSGPVHFTAMFSGAVTGFTSSGVTIAGTAPGNKKATVNGGPMTYDVTISGMTGPGTVIPSIQAGAATGIASGLENLAATSTDNTVTMQAGPPPSITSFASATGNIGTAVTISGSNFTGLTGVLFNGVPATSFSIVPNPATAVQLLTNPGFETGNFSGWTATSQPGGSGTFVVLAGTSGLISGSATVGPHNGSMFYAVTDQGGPGAQALIQPFTIPGSSPAVNLSFSMFDNDYDGGPLVNAAGLDYTAFPNQHARVDILTAAATAFDTGAGVKTNFYLGVDPHTNPNPYRNYSFDITDLVGGGGTFQLRFAQVDNEFYQNLGVDDVSIQYQPASDTTMTIQAIVPPGTTTGQITVSTLGGIATSLLPFTISPGITSLNPPFAPPGSPNTPMIVTGSGFLPGAALQWTMLGQTTSIPATLQSAALLQATIPASLLSSPGTAQVVVANPVGPLTNAVPFTIGPGLTSLNPVFSPAGSPDTPVTINGTGFLSGAALQWTMYGQTTSIPATLQNAALMQATIPASLLSSPGTAQLVVANPTGPPTNAVPFTVGPGLTSLSPPFALSGSPDTLVSVNGAGFLAGAAVRWTMSGQITSIPATLKSAALLQATIPASLLSSPDTAQIVVWNPTGPSTNALPFAIGPGLTSLSPIFALPGSPDTPVTIHGAGFLSGAAVQWTMLGQTTSIPATLKSAALLQATIPASLLSSPGTAQVVIANPASPPTNAVPFTIGPGLISLNPVFALPGGPDISVSIYGAGFVAGAAIKWTMAGQTTSIPATMQNPGLLQATIPASLLVNPGTAQVAVANPAGSSSNSLPFLIDQPLTVTIEQAAAQADPTATSPINFTAVFSEVVTGFTSSGLTLSGSANPAAAAVTGSGTTYNIAVSGMTAQGTVIATVNANAVTGNVSGLGNLDSTSADNSVNYTGEIVKKRAGQVTSD
jgi:hypothetical protein